MIFNIIDADNGQTEEERGDWQKNKILSDFYCLYLELLAKQFTKLNRIGEYKINIYLNLCVDE